MKKILFIIPLLALLMGVYSCGDNEDFSNPHILTQEEMDTLRVQDSLANLNTPLELTYTVNIYDGKGGGFLEIDMDAIGTKFNMTASQAASAINALTITPTYETEDGTKYTSDQCTANGVWGYWLNNQGVPTSWGSDGYAFYLEWDGTSGFNYGYNDGALVVGDVVHSTFKLEYQGSEVYVYITTNYLAADAFVDPEEKPGTTPADLTKDITLSKAWSDDWANETYDAHDELCNAFNMTTYELSEALDAGELKVYLNEVTDAEPSYTADPGGYWINSQGQSTNYGTDSYIFCGLYMDYTASSITISTGNYPDESMCPKGVSLSFKMIITNGTTTATYNVTVNIQ